MHNVNFFEEVSSGTQVEVEVIKIDKEQQLKLAWEIRTKKVLRM